MTANLTDDRSKPSDDLHLFITSLFSYDFFHDLEYPFEGKHKHEIKWWYPELLCDFNEQITIFELFKRRMTAGYKKYGEKIASIIVILPSNFNDTHNDVTIDPLYGDKVIVLTRKLAKLYYIISQAFVAGTLYSKIFVNIVFLQINSIIAESYEIQNNTFRFQERIEKNVSLEKANETIKSTLSHFKHSSNSLTIIFIDGCFAVDVNEFDEEKKFIIERKGLKEDDILFEGALFKYKTDYDGNMFSIVDDTKKLPNLKVAYELLSSPSIYHPISDGFGIDLGTCRSALAFHRLFKDECYIDLIPADISDISGLLYSWVAFDQKEPICGKYGYERSKTKAPHIVYDTKKFIGRRYNDIKNQIDETWPFTITDDNGNIKIIVKDYDNVDKELSPEDIYAYLLEHLKNNAKDLRNAEIKQAVFTVPSTFSPAQRRATQKAAQYAKIKVLKFLPEPTAAVLSYCSRLEKKLENGSNIFIFDLGGGTTDFSIFNVQNNKVLELCQYSNHEIGGSEFTKVLYEDFRKGFIKEGLHNLFEKDLKEEVKTKIHELWVKSIIAKEDLTEALETNANIGDVDVGITRDKFEDLAKPLIQKLKESIQEALNKANLKAADITLVVKVGGSCIMPMITKLLRETFPYSELDKSDPEREVALGAALYAASILPKKPATPFIKNHWPLY